MRVVLPLVLIAATALPGVALSDIKTARERARSGTFDDSGEVRCAQEVGEPLKTCTAKVARADGAAVAVVSFANGFSRMLMFEDGEFRRGNATMSGVGTDFDWRLSKGIYHVRVDDQRFELPEVLIFGE
ncbi:hypothetical protein [Antarctobacter jejuensis]|uniref:hypothetical protein n=1 Tax=Antarctobacter jejuensis TaxID=1439938 RepID=UPI003FD661D0